MASEAAEPQQSADRLVVETVERGTDDHVTAIEINVL
jgi:hypothetical protein